MARREYIDDLNPDQEGDSVWLGIAAGFVAALLLEFVVFVAMIAALAFLDPGDDSYFGIPFLIAMFQIGWIQVLVLPPYAWTQRRRGWPRKAKGILLMSGVLFLLGSLCNAARWLA